MISNFKPLELVENLARDLAAEARQRQIQLVSFCAPEMPTTLVGNTQTVQSILHLLTKIAMQSLVGMKDGAVIIEALLDKELEKDCVRFAVSDSRTQVTVAEARQLVAEIMQLKIEDGCVSSILKELDTKLEFDFELLGRSTRLYFTTPLERGKIQAAEAPITQYTAGLKLFLVANDPAPNRIIQHYCRFAGFDVDGAPTASETILELGRDAKVDVLAVAPPIEDIQPIHLVKLIKSSTLDNIKILYISPWDDSTDRQAHRDAGFDGTIAKPFTRKELLDSIQQLAGHTPHKKAKAPLVLVAEDNPINAQIASFQLGKIGYDADLVSNGKEALDALESGEYVAVLMDIQMPVMDGIEATIQIRRRESLKEKSQIPVIALTANAEKREIAMAAGCNHFLTKPATISDLQSALDKFLGSVPKYRFN